MQQILLLSHSRLLENHSVAVEIVMLGRLPVGIIVKDTSPLLLLPWNSAVFFALIMRGCASRCDILDMGWCLFPIIFDLDFGQEVTPILMAQ